MPRMKTRRESDATRAIGIVEGCKCAKEDLLVREALVALLDRIKGGFIRVDCRFCGTAWMIDLATGKRTKFVVN